jgi:signal transduction histidine kinase
MKLLLAVKKRIPFKIILLTAFLLSQMFVFAQNQTIIIPKFRQSRNGEKIYEDSIKSVGKRLEIELSTKPQNPVYDSLRIQLFVTMSEVYVDANRYNLDTASMYADKLYFYAKKYNKKRLMMDALFRKELKFNRLHQYSESLKLCFEAIDLCDQLGKECGQRWKIENILGNTFLYSADYPNAEKYILQSLQSINDEGSNVKLMLPIDKGFLHGTLAKIYLRWKKPIKAEQEYLTQLELMKQANFEDAVANASEELGDFYNNNGRPNEALPYYDKALEINLKKNNEESLASVYNSKAETYLNLKDYNKALEFAGKSMFYAQKNKLSLLLPFTYHVIFQANIGLGNELEALRANQKYWSLKDSNDLKKRVIDLSDARRLYELEQAKNQREKERITEEYRIGSLQKQYEITKLTNTSLEQDFKLQSISRKLENEHALAIQQALRIESDNQKNEQERLTKQLKVNELSNKLILENQQQNSLLIIVGLISLLGVSAIIYSLNLRRKNKELQIKNHEIQEALLKGQTIERKRVASELHDNVGSLLSAVRVSLLTLNSAKLPNHDQKVYSQIQGMVENACREVRLISHNLLPEELEKFGLEIALGKMIERLNFSTPIEFTLNTKGLKEQSFDRKIAFHIYSICLELINNILKHSEATDAAITFRKSGNTLELFVRDNGKGLQNYLKGQGIASIEERVEEMNGILEIDSEVGEGTRTHISVPITQPTYVASQI